MAFQCRQLLESLTNHDAEKYLIMTDFCLDYTIHTLYRSVYTTNKERRRFHASLMRDIKERHDGQRIRIKNAVCTKKGNKEM